MLFADIRGSTQLIEELDPEQAMYRLEPAIAAMVRAVHAFGGTVNRTLGDGIMALFGAPVAFEDHAVRACFAAHSIISAIGSLGDNNVSVRVGLNSGEVVVRSIGHDLSMEYDVVGATAHLAKRMEELAAPGTAVITAHTAQCASGFIKVRSRGMVGIRGLSRPMQIYELVGTADQSRWQVRAAAHNLSRFVGRNTEQLLLLNRWERAKGGRGQIVAIAGEAGMGKSRLLHEFLEHAALDGSRSLHGAAMPHDRNTPYRFVAGMLRTWLGVGAQHAREAIETRLREATLALGTEDDLDVTPLRFLLDLPIEGPQWPALEPVQRRMRIHECIRSLVLHVAAARPYVLALEDLHWIDAGSLAALEPIMDGLGAANLMIVLTYRPEYEHRWAHLSYYSLIQLGPLDRDSADTLLRGLIGDAPELAALRTRIVEESDATPLFLEEMARNLIETGVLVSETTKFRLTRDPSDVEVPASVQVVLASRIDRLPTAERSLLQVASVIGKDVTVDLLAAVSEIPSDQLARQLLELRSLEFLHAMQGGGYTFKHALTHAVAYDSMLLSQRRMLHRRVLAAIEERFAERIDELTERLADHAMRGELWEKSVEYCQRAGQRANTRSAHAAAIGFFERALDALGRLPASIEAATQGIESRLGLRVALAARGDLTQILKHLRDAEELSRAIGDERRLTPILISRSTIQTNLGDLDDAIRAGLEGRELAERMSDEACLVSSAFALGQAWGSTGALDSAARILGPIADQIARGTLKTSSGTTGTASVLCLVSLSHTHCLTGRLDEALARARTALEIANETGRPYDLSYASAAVGLSHLTRGTLEPATHHLEGALRVARAHEILLLVPHAARYLGRAYALAGRLHEAEALLSEVIEQARSKFLAALQGWCAASLAQTRLLAGALDSAASVAAEAGEIARRHGYRPLEVHATRIQGMIELARLPDTAAAERAEVYLRKGAAAAERLGMLPELALYQQRLGELLAATGRADPAAAAWERAVALRESCGVLFPESYISIST